MCSIFSWNGDASDQNQLLKQISESFDASFPRRRHVVDFIRNVSRNPHSVFIRLYPFLSCMIIITTILTFSYLNALHVTLNR